MTAPLFDFASAPMVGRPTPPALELVVYGIPAPQGSKNARPIYKGRGRNKVFTGKVALEESSKKVKPWRAEVEEAAAAAMGDQRLMLEVPLLVEMVFTLPRPGSRPSWWPTGAPWSKTSPMRPAGYPDVSKLARSTEDALTTAGVWKDDGRVVEYGRLAKVFPRNGSGLELDALDRPGAIIRIYILRAYIPGDPT